MSAVDTARFLALALRIKTKIQAREHHDAFGP
jgi:hypothetical protein